MWKVSEICRRIIIGRRLEGSYNWDDSSYNQRWLLHRSLQTITKAPILRDIIASLGGSIYLVGLLIKMYGRPQHANHMRPPIAPLPVFHMAERQRHPTRGLYPCYYILEPVLSGRTLRSTTDLSQFDPLAFLSLHQVWYFRLLGAEIGRGVCLYPNGADPPMTEPDLVVIDDGACVDDASLVCHINSRVSSFRVALATPNKQ